GLARRPGPRRGCGGGGRPASGGTLGGLRGRRELLGPPGPDVAVDLPALVELDPSGADLALDLAGRLELEAALGRHRSGHLPADDRVLCQDVALDHAVLADDHCLAGADCPLDVSLDPECAVCRAVAVHAHARTDDRDYAVARGRRAVRFLGHVTLILGVVPGRALRVPADERHRVPQGAATKRSGSTGFPSMRTSKCRCGADERPLVPTRASGWPDATLAPALTSSVSAWPYSDCTPPPWSITT